MIAGKYMLGSNAEAEASVQPQDPGPDDGRALSSLRALASLFHHTVTHSASVCSSCFGTGLADDPGEMAEVYSKSEVSGIAKCSRCHGRGAILAGHAVGVRV